MRERERKRDSEKKKELREKRDSQGIKERKK